ncbi:MAG TPA: lytic transglycosylase domain-containing protein, partial [Ensifer sp.]|nr:lytic transglycosylase domain-containing protein [Ensifer sp.]HEV7317505.1 lytic transglycosylase domain-containing protein [Ensifer sp.]
MRISSVAAVAACLGMFFAGMGTSYAGNVDR